MHALLSLQFIAVCRQPATASQVSIVQGSESSQLCALCVQAPDGSEQLSSVQALLSLQFLLACRQPVAALQLSRVQARPSLQFTGVVRQRPLLQWSFSVQALESVQAFASFGLPIQAPPSGSHSSSVQVLPSSQPLVEPETQAPAEQVPSAQALSLEQAVPLNRLPTRHWLTLAGLQISYLHSWLCRPKLHWLANGAQAPRPLHCPSHTVLAELGRQPAPAGALTTTQLLPWQTRLHAASPIPSAVPHTRPSRFAAPNRLIFRHAIVPLASNAHTPWHSSRAPPGPSGSQGIPKVFGVQLKVIASDTEATASGELDSWAVGEGVEPLEQPIVSTQPTQALTVTRLKKVIIPLRNPLAEPLRPTLWATLSAPEPRSQRR